MARPVEFDREHALEEAMKLFWRQGYSATSLAQLLDAMGIGRSSFYAAYGDKRTLFSEALDLFAERTAAMLADAAAGEESSVETIRRFFLSTLFDVDEDRMRCGCMMVNTVLELADVDPGLSEHAARNLGRIEKAFEHCIARDIATGRLRSNRSPRDLALFLMLVNQGLRVASRKRASRRELRRTVDTAMALLAAAP